MYYRAALCVAAVGRPGGIPRKPGGAERANSLLGLIQENCFLDLRYTTPLQVLVRPDPGLLRTCVIKVGAFEKEIFLCRRKGVTIRALAQNTIYSALVCTTEY